NALPQRERGAPETPANRQLFHKALTGMRKMQQAALRTQNVESLRGYEGKAAAYYFQALGTLLDSAWNFTGRVYYPPPDPFNALLSFSYSLLLKDVVSAVNQVGFDAYVGFFHEIDYGRPSLALDLMEEWRPLIADAMSLELVNRRILLPDTFTWTNSPQRPVILGDEGVARVFAAYGERLEVQLYHPLAGPGGNTTTRQAIVLQSRRLAHVIMERETVYEAMKAK
ncbi:MAG: CRISPR-associated endonuclease Cas1, partial [Anaerolineales bacterium]|nr:CRISPR-associated endonuclease Cas1 [Anaerolineales bacterium]